MNGAWTPPDTRDNVVDFINDLGERTEVPTQRIVAWVGVSCGKFYSWNQRYGKVNEHNAKVPRDHWLTEDERQRIIAFQQQYPLEGYRRLTFMMLDGDIVAVSPTTTWRVLSQAGLLARWNKRPSKKGTGFVQPTTTHEHWHIDVAYLNLGGTFFYLCSVLDGCSRAIIHWELRERMTEVDVECILQAAREQHPEARPRVISENGPQFISRDFKEFIRIAGMTHVRTSPYYPQSNGKIERWHKTVKSEAIRPACPSTPDQARAVVDRHVRHYNSVRLHSAIGFVTPNDVLAGRAGAIFAARDLKLEVARQRRQQARQTQRASRENHSQCQGDPPLGSRDKESLAPAA